MHPENKTHNSTSGDQSSSTSQVHDHDSTLLDPATSTIRPTPSAECLAALAVTEIETYSFFDWKPYFEQLQQSFNYKVDSYEEHKPGLLQAINELSANAIVMAIERFETTLECPICHEQPTERSTNINHVFSDHMHEIFDNFL